MKASAIQNNGCGFCAENDGTVDYNKKKREISDSKLSGKREDVKRILKLNADIIFEALKKRYPVQMYGVKETSLVLPRPEFHMDEDANFLANHLYLATAAHLPARPALQKGAVLICIGEPVRMKYYTDRITLLVIRAKKDFFSVFHAIQQIYDYYEQWNEKLFEVFQQDADLQKIVELSAQALGHPICVLDSSFHILASVSEVSEGEKWEFGAAGSSLAQEDLAEFLNYSEMAMDIHEPMLLKMGEVTSLAVNLFDRSGMYVGCFFMPKYGKSFSGGDLSLAAYLGTILEKSLEHNPTLLTNDQNTLRQVLRELVEECPIRPAHRAVLQALQKKSRYVCVSVHFISKYSQIPTSYICSLFDTNFPGSASFTGEEAVIAFVDLKYLYDKNGKYQDNLNARLDPMLKAMKLYAGISNDFSNLYDARMYYLQAEIAIENGQLTSAGQNGRYYFSSFVLMEMIANSTGGMPVEMYYSNGLKNLFRHDSKSSVSYFETLRIFLEENMNYTSTAELLYIHRSTLVERIARIEKELGIDLKDYNERLHLQIIIKALELREILKGDEKIPV